MPSWCQSEQHTTKCYYYRIKWVPGVSSGRDPDGLFPSDWKFSPEDQGEVLADDDGVVAVEEGVIGPFEDVEGLTMESNIVPEAGDRCQVCVNTMCCIFSKRKPEEPWLIWLLQACFWVGPDVLQAEPAMHSTFEALQVQVINQLLHDYVSLLLHELVVAHQEVGHAAANAIEEQGDIPVLVTLHSYELRIIGILGWKLLAQLGHPVEGTQHVVEVLLL